MPGPPTNNWEGFEEFQSPIFWQTVPHNTDPIFFIAEVDGEKLGIRINEFPVDPLYSLLKNGTVLLRFDD